MKIKISFLIVLFTISASAQNNCMRIRGFEYYEDISFAKSALLQEKSDLNRANLKGNILSVETTPYTYKEEFGENVKQLMPCDNFTEYYNAKGYIYKKIFKLYKSDEDKDEDEDNGGGNVFSNDNMSRWEEYYNYDSSNKLLNIIGYVKCRDIRKCEHVPIRGIDNDEDIREFTKIGKIDTIYKSGDSSKIVFTYLPNGEVKQINEDISVMDVSDVYYHDIASGVSESHGLILDIDKYYGCYSRCNSTTKYTYSINGFEINKYSGSCNNPDDSQDSNYGKLLYKITKKDDTIIETSYSNTADGQIAGIFSYDPSGRLLKCADEYGYVCIYKYNELGDNITKIKCKNNHICNTFSYFYTYDDHNNWIICKCYEGKELYKSINRKIIYANDK